MSSIPEALQHVGCIGLGIMGAPMAGNLRHAGCRLHVWNRSPEKTRPLVEAGAEAAPTPAAMAQAGPAVIFLNVTDTEAVETVLFGEDGVAAGARPGLVVVDHSTIHPGATETFARRLAEREVRFLDAPVSGGDTGARAGTLSIMVGGDPATFEHCRPLLEVVGSQVTHLGPAGAGQACKACNQVAVAGALLGACEAITLARALGLDPDRMLEVVSRGAGGSWQLENLGPRIVREDFEPGFMVRLMLKDLGIVEEAAADRHARPLESAALARRHFQTLAEAGLGEDGTQALARAVSGELPSSR